MLTRNAFDPQCLTIFQMNLIFNIRIFWRRLTIWTILYLVSGYKGIGTSEEAFSNIYLEFLDFGNMLEIIFGRESTAEYTAFSNTYAFLWRDLITAQLEGDTEAVQQYVNRLYQTVNEGAAFLASINPFMDEAVLRSLFGTYLLYTIEQANSIMTGEYNIAITDRLTELTNRLGDYFAESVYEYITSGFRYVPQPGDVRQCISYEQMNEIYSIRMFWFELILWIRAYMLSLHLGIGKTDEVYNRLRQVPLDYVNSLKGFFGEHPAEDDLLRELYTYIDLIGTLFTAQKAGNMDEIDRITRLLYKNADERAASISSLNPAWNEEEWRSRLYRHIRYTIAGSSSLLAGDYARNLDIFRSLMNLADSASGYFAKGLLQYLFTAGKMNTRQPESLVSS